MTVAQWFAKHPQAKKRLDKWVGDRRSGEESDGIRGLLAHLQNSHAFPFQDHTSLWKFAKREHGTIESPKKAPAVHTHTRTDTELRKIEKGDTFFVTSAVSNCYADPGFLQAIERWREELGAKVIVNGVRYQNPTRPNEEVADEWYDPALARYMLNQEIRPHPKLSILPTKVQATASNPLPPRIAGLTQGRHTILGHPQLAMKTVPTLDGEAKVMWSTGAITRPQYSETLAGTMGEFHHGLAGVIVEVRDDDVLMREVTWDGNGFTDCEWDFRADGTYEAPAPLALVMGDIHDPLVSKDVMEATFGEGGIYDCMKHERIVLHDLADFRNVNPHDWGKLTHAALAQSGRNSVQDDIDSTAQWINNLPTDPDLVVCRSNHDEFLTRWLQDGERNVTPVNRKLYHELSFQILDEFNRTGKFPVTLELALRGKVREGVRFLNFDESFRLAGVEMGQHGHLGPNGARGSILNYARMAVRTIIAHAHSPGIWQGCYQVAHSGVQDHGYNRGPSSWWNAHVTLHANGQRQMHLITVKGRWRG